MTDTTESKDKKSLSQKWDDYSTGRKIMLILLLVFVVGLITYGLYTLYTSKKKEGINVNVDGGISFTEL